jgi:hypothetical protein
MIAQSVLRSGWTTILLKLIELGRANLRPLDQAATFGYYAWHNV